MALDEIQNNVSNKAKFQYHIGAKWIYKGILIDRKLKPHGVRVFSCHLRENMGVEPGSYLELQFL